MFYVKLGVVKTSGLPKDRCADTIQRVHEKSVPCEMEGRLVIYNHVMLGGCEHVRVRAFAANGRPINEHNEIIRI